MPWLLQIVMSLNFHLGMEKSSSERGDNRLKVPDNRLKVPEFHLTIVRTLNDTGLLKSEIELVSRWQAQHFFRKG